jgi:hypothetical protein
MDYSKYSLAELEELYLSELSEDARRDYARKGALEAAPTPPGIGDLMYANELRALQAEHMAAHLDYVQYTRKTSKAQYRGSSTLDDWTAKKKEAKSHCERLQKEIERLKVEGPSIETTKAIQDKYGKMIEELRANAHANASSASDSQSKPVKASSASDDQSKPRSFSSSAPTQAKQPFKSGAAPTMAAPSKSSASPTMAAQPSKSASSGHTKAEPAQAQPASTTSSNFEKCHVNAATSSTATSSTTAAVGSNKTGSNKEMRNLEARVATLEIGRCLKCADSVAQVNRLTDQNRVLSGTNSELKKNYIKLLELNVQARTVATQFEQANEKLVSKHSNLLKLSKDMQETDEKLANENNQLVTRVEQLSHEVERLTDELKDSEDMGKQYLKLFEENKQLKQELELLKATRTPVPDDSEYEMASDSD